MILDRGELALVGFDEGVNVSGCPSGGTCIGAEQGRMGVLTWSEVEWDRGHHRAQIRLTEMSVDPIECSVHVEARLSVMSNLEKQ